MAGSSGYTIEDAPRGYQIGDEETEEQKAAANPPTAKFDIPRSPTEMVGEGEEAQAHGNEQMAREHPAALTNAALAGIAIPEAGYGIAEKGIAGYAYPAARALAKSYLVSKGGEALGRHFGGETGAQIGKWGGALVGPAAIPDAAISRFPGAGSVFTDEELAGLRAKMKLTQRAADIKAGLRKGPSDASPAAESPNMPGPTVARPARNLIVTPEEARSRDQMFKIAETAAKRRGMEFAGGQVPAEGRKVPRYPTPIASEEYGGARPGSQVNLGEIVPPEAPQGPGTAPTEATPAPAEAPKTTGKRFTDNPNRPGANGRPETDNLTDLVVARTGIDRPSAEARVENLIRRAKSSNSVEAQQANRYINELLAQERRGKR